MNYEDFETELIRKQNLYIRKLEEQLAVYEEKDRAQELLINQLNQTLELFAEELSRLKNGKEEGWKEKKD